MGIKPSVEVLNNVFLETLRLLENLNDGVILSSVLLKVALQNELVHTVNYRRDNLNKLNFLIVLVH